jgi:hypothetical protein
MNRRALLMAAGCIGLALSLAACEQTVEYRYRLAIEFDTPDGVKSALSVIRVTRGLASALHPLKGVIGPTWKLQGDAVFVDLGLGKNAIALLTHGAKGGSGDGIKTIWVSAYGYPSLNEDVWSGRVKVSGLRELARDDVPTIITFTDIADPATAKVIFATDYHQRCMDKARTMPNCQTENFPVPIDEIAGTLGAGYAFRRATVELVPNDTPVTRGIEDRIPVMMAKLREQNKEMQLVRPTDPFRMGPGLLSVR